MLVINKDVELIFEFDMSDEDKELSKFKQHRMKYW